MSAFNDYCIVCDQLCSSNSVYCSESCKLTDQLSTLNIDASSPSTEVPQSYLSPLLQPTLQYQSPLLSSTVDSTLDLDQDCLTLSYETVNCPKGKSQSYISDYLSTTTINYKKWLHSTKAATISN